MIDDYMYPEIEGDTRSPIEAAFAHDVVKYLQPDVRILAQAPIETIAGNFLVDFAIVSGAKRVGIECDGRDFHDLGRDEWRDALILATGKFDAIYRIRGEVIHYEMNDALYVLTRHEPMLFSVRGKDIVACLATGWVVEHFGSLERLDNLTHFIYRHTIANRHLRGLYAFASLNTRRSIDDIIAEFRRIMDEKLKAGTNVAYWDYLLRMADQQLK